jgi:hypothetical protein
VLVPKSEGKTHSAAQADLKVNWVKLCPALAGDKDTTQVQEV